MTRENLWLPSDNLNFLDYKSLWQQISLQEAEHTTPTISGWQLLITRMWHGSHIGGNMSPNNHSQWRFCNQVFCDVFLCKMELVSCLLVIFLCKRKVFQLLCHLAVKLPLCSNYIMICGGIYKFLFQISEILDGLWIQAVSVNFCSSRWQQIWNFHWFMS